MNDMIQIETPGTALAIIPRSQLPTILAADQNDILGKLAKELSGYEPDASTPAGRTKINVVKKSIGTAKMDFVRLADTLMEDAKKTIVGVTAERKIIERRMDEMRDDIGHPLAEYMEREKARTDAHESLLAQIESYLPVPADMPSSRISEAIAAVDEFLPGGAIDWEEFKDRAGRVCARVAAGLIAAEVDARKREAEAAELARLRAEQAERDRLAAIEAQRRREEQIAAEAAETARKAAEERAARLAKEAEEQAQAQLQAAEALRVHQAAEAERREREAADALAKAEAERLAGIERERVAKEKAEALRIKGHEDALEQMDALTNVTPGTSSQVIQATLQAFITWSGHDRDWQEFAELHAALRDSGREHLNQCLKHATDAEAAAAAEKAEADRVEAARVAERNRVIAIESERARVAIEAAAQKAADEKRAADVAHRTKINREAIAGLMTVSSEVTEDLAKLLLVAIVKGKVANCKVEY